MPNKESLRKPSEVINIAGIHARSAALIVHLSESFPDTNLMIIKSDTVARADNMIDLLMLEATMGTQLELVAEGPSAAEALDALEALIASGFSEDQ